MALVKNWQFFHILLKYSKIAQQSVFESILERKRKELSLVLVKNWQFFDLFNIGKKDRKNVSENILERNKSLSRL